MMNKNGIITRHGLQARKRDGSFTELDVVIGAICTPNGEIAFLMAHLHDLAGGYKTIQHEAICRTLM